ncbi:MAG: histidine--tRNA ligase [Bradymonadia bacterium]
MTKVTPKVLRGFKDYLPDTMLSKQRMLDQIARVFESFGFGPLVTPAIEYAEILMGKYGDEGDKLLYRFRDNGDRDVALRYDLTVPLSRVVAMNPQLLKPFKRYQIAPVWRAEKPGRGRFREFMQCDIDIVGAADMMADAECLLVGASALQSIGVTDFIIRINNRKLLTALLKKYHINEGPDALGVLRTLDKLPKIGEEKTRTLLATENGLNSTAVDGIFAFLTLSPNQLADFFEEDEVGKLGAEEIQTVLTLAEEMGIGDRVEVDLSIARGLDYYTGTIYETFLTNVDNFGAIMSGGRYDELLDVYGRERIPSVGISLGIDRLFSALVETGKIDLQVAPTQVLVTIFNESLRPKSFQIANTLREAGFATEIFPGTPKMKKQLQYANRRSVSFVIFIGVDEARDGLIKIKNMDSGEEKLVAQSELITHLNSEMA